MNAPVVHTVKKQLRSKREKEQKPMEYLFMPQSALALVQFPCEV